MSDLYLGVDGGQSSTVAVIGNAEGKILGWATAGPCNHVGAAEAAKKFLGVMRECLSAAIARAGLASAKPRFRSACLGMSGGPADKTALLSELIDCDQIIVTDDARIALAGATAGQPGAIVIAGTGSIAFGENAQGETARAGGWGYVFGDEGGGFDIARQALRAILREHEGWGPRTALTPLLLEATETSNANDTLHAFYTADWPRSRVATLAVLVDEAAGAGDPTAIEILQSAAQHLASHTATVRRQLWRENEPAKLSWIGGVFNSTLVLENFRRLAAAERGFQIGPPLYSPAFGALLMAFRHDSVTLVPEPIDEIKI